MTAHRIGDKAKGDITVRIGKADRATQAHMAEGIGPHAVRGARVIRVFHHAAQPVTHGSQQRAIHALALLTIKLLEQLRADQTSAQQSAVEPGQTMGGTVAVQAGMAKGPPAWVRGLSWTTRRVSERQGSHVLGFRKDDITQVLSELITHTALA